MPTYAVLLRGVNLGRRGKLPMADLRQLLAELGYDDVRTHLNSGNAVFTTPDADPAALASAIEDALDERFGRRVPCLVKTAAELHEVIGGNPLTHLVSNGSQMMVHFLFRDPDPALLTAHDPSALAPHEIALGDRVVYQWCPDGFHAAPAVGGLMESKVGVAVTTRNWNTVTKLGTLVGS